MNSEPPGCFGSWRRFDWAAPVCRANLGDRRPGRPLVDLCDGRTNPGSQPAIVEVWLTRRFLQG